MTLQNMPPEFKDYSEMKATEKKPGSQRYLLVSRNKLDQLKLPKLSRVISGCFWVDMSVSELSPVHTSVFLVKLEQGSIFKD